MSKTFVLNGKETTGNAGENISIDLTRSYNLQHIVFNLTVTHTNAAAIAAAVTPFEFFGSAIDRIQIDVGAGNDIVNLSMVEHMVRMLKDRRRLDYVIDKTIGANKVSNILLVVDLSSINMVTPKDTILNTTAYNHLKVNIKVGAAAAAVADLTITSLTTTLREQQIANMKPLLVNGKKAGPMHRRPVVITKAIVADQKGFAIEFPKNERFTSISLFVLDGDSIVSDAIDVIKLKIKQNYRFQDTMNQLNRLNRFGLITPTDTDFDDIAILEIAHGQYTGVIDTRQVNENSGQIELDVVVGAATAPVVVAIFETLING